MEDNHVGAELAGIITFDPASEEVEVAVKLLGGACRAVFNIMVGAVDRCLGYTGALALVEGRRCAAGLRCWAGCWAALGWLQGRCRSRRLVVVVVLAVGRHSTPKHTRLSPCRRHRAQDAAQGG